MRRASAWGALVIAATLAGCSAIPDKPLRATLYDFGPLPMASAPLSPPATLPPLVLADIEVTGALDGSAVLYRLGYADQNQLRPYSQARWTAPPPQLIRQRIRQRLGFDRPVLDLGESAALARSGGAATRVLRMGLEEFSHLFETQERSWGVLRLRATLLENTPAGERMLAQRTFVVRQPAPSPDAPGGVRALAAATDEVAQEITRWMQAVQ
jgi:cholesterol transport system auxiliary component